MITFQKKGTRGSSSYKHSGTPVLIVDPRPEEGRAAGFGLNREAVELLNLTLTGEEYLAFTVEDNRVFAVVGEKGEFAKAFRVGKTYATIGDTRVVRGNHKPTWEYLAETPLVTDNGATLKFVKAEESANVDRDVYELVSLMPEADNSPEAQEEAEAADWADSQPETVDFEGF